MTRKIMSVKKQAGWLFLISIFGIFLCVIGYVLDYVDRISPILRDAATYGYLFEREVAV